MKKTLFLGLCSIAAFSASAQTVLPTLTINVDNNVLPALAAIVPASGDSATFEDSGGANPNLTLVYPKPAAPLVNGSGTGPLAASIPPDGGSPDGQSLSRAVVQFYVSNVANSACPSDKTGLDPCSCNPTWVNGPLVGIVQHITVDIDALPAAGGYEAICHTVLS